MAIEPLERPVLGVAYYPEHWPESRWKSDAKLLHEAGISVVRMMEFAWDRLEPRPGQYDFKWMDKAISIFEAQGIQVVLCTPTATPPPYLTKLHPEMQRVDEKTALRASTGSRRSMCACVPAYLEESDRIVAAIAKQWGKHKNVIGWQIDNEFGCHWSTRCICDYCRAAFQQWCEEKYKTLDALNEAWGTAFWSMTYTAWDEIPVTAPTTAGHNPGLLLDYRRFSSDVWVAYQRRQIDILRPIIGNKRFITHNMMMRFSDINYFDLARDLDFVSYDNYPHGLSGPGEAALNLDIIRGLKDRQFWVMEQQSGHVNWTGYNPPVPPGQVRAWSYQAIAHGAEGVCYFRERAVNIGQEQYHAGLLKHDGTTDRGWHEARQLHEELQKQPVLKKPKASVAIMFDYNDQWVIELDPHNRDFSYYNLVLDIYRQLWDAHIPVDIVPRDADLKGYDAVIVPAPAIIDDKHAESWTKYVKGGGNLVVTFRAFFKNQGNTWTDQPSPAGKLGELLGATVDEFMSIPSTPNVGWRSARENSTDWSDERGSQAVEVARGTVGFGIPASSKAHYHTWAEVLTPTSAETLMRYADGYYKDSAAVTVNRVGKGAAYMIGCWCESVIPRLVWQGLDLKRFEISERDSTNSLEIIKMQDKSGNPVELRINHHRRTISLPEQVRE